MQSLVQALALLSALGAAISVPTDRLDSAIHVRSPENVAPSDVISAIRRELNTVALEKRQSQYNANATFDTSWNDATLLSIGVDANYTKGPGSGSTAATVSLICKTCYVKGTAVGNLSIAGTFNATQAVDQVENDFEADIRNLTSAAGTYVEQYLETLGEDIVQDLSTFTWTEHSFPTFENFSFEIDNLSGFPAVTLDFTLDGLEIYMEVDLVLDVESSYSIRLFTSPDDGVGIAVSDDLELGIVFTVDLLLDMNAQLDLSSGFHIKMNDGLGFQIALFGDEVLHIDSPGGQFEFFPVVVESGGFVFTAKLQLGVYTGIEIGSSHDGVSGGVGFSVFANIAEFITNVTATPDSTTCELPVVQSYQLVLGAAAGATIAIDSHTWGPAATASTPVWYTEMASLCAVTPTSTQSAVPVSAPGSSLTTTTTEITYTGVKCASSGLINCPASLQETVPYTTTSTLVTAVPTGGDFYWPATQTNVVALPSPFGEKAVVLPTTSGRPVSYVPTSEATNIHPASTGKTIKCDINGLLARKKLIIEVSVGVGAPLLIVVLVLSLLLYRAKRRASGSPNINIAATPYSPIGFHPQYDPKQSKAMTQVTEMQLE